MTLHVTRRRLACGLCTSALLLLPAAAAGQGSRNAPAAPTNLQSALDGQSRVTLTWTDQSTNELGFRIVRERQLSSSTWGDAAGFTVGSDIATYLDSPSLGTYRYRVRAYNQKGNSSYTPRVEVTVSAASQVPAAPTGLAVQDSGGGNARLTWTDASSNETGFDLERQPAFAASPQRVGADVVTFDDATLGGTFAYRVRAINATGSSSFTSWVSASIQAPSNSLTSPPFPALIPRSGWTGPTPQPPAVGTPGAPGYDAKAIARWDVVPYQTFTSDFNVGVVAFHMNGIDRVDFAVNGGPWVSVRQMLLNPQTNVWEYTAMLRAADFADGAVEVRAIAWPSTGEPRLLESLLVTANAHATLPALVRYVSPIGSDSTGTGTAAAPYKSINKAAKSIDAAQGGSADGGVVYLTAGDHTWGEAGRDAAGLWIGYPVTSNRFLTVARAPGTNRGDVRIGTSLGGGLRTKLVAVQGVKVIGVSLDTGSPPTGGAPVLWIDDCDFTSNDAIRLVNWASDAEWTGGVYATGVSVTASANGWQNALLVRNAVIDGIGNDALICCKMVINTEVKNIVNPPASGFHSDVFQYFTVSPAFDNVILYNVRAHDNTAQGFHIGYTGHIKGPEWSNFAMVNIVNDFTEPTAQWIPDINHLLMWNLTFPSKVVMIRDNPLGEPTTVRNLSIRACTFNRFGFSATGGPSLADHSWADNNHFMDVATYGAISVGGHFTTGGTLGSLFVDSSRSDFRPASASPLRDRVAGLLVPCDAANLPRTIPASIGGLRP